MVRTATVETYRVPNWLPDDTEESIVGSEWHQEAIGALATMLRAVKERRGATWGVCQQVELSGLRRADGTAYGPRPDVMVLAQPLAGERSSIPLAEAGTPLFIAELASPSTVRNDRVGKREVYAAIGVREYLLYDPVGNVLSAPIEAWHLPSPTATKYVPWEPGADGWWQITMLDVSLQPGVPFLRVRDRDGLLLDTPLGAMRRLWQLEQELQAERRERQRLEEEIRRLTQASGADERES